ncbi:MAG: fasciclin domain-containing protein [Hyphomonadaceae bacterium]
MARLSVVSIADRAGFYIFAEALRSSDHYRTLEDDGPFTVFAPTDAAFGAMPPVALDTFLHRDRLKLQRVLGYHIASGRVAAARFAGKRIRATMRTGGEVLVDGRAGLKANDARVIKPDLDAANGVVHGIDALLWPRDASAGLGAP